MAKKSTSSGRGKRDNHEAGHRSADFGDAETEKAIAALKFAIQALQSMECGPGCENKEPVIEMYQWALREFDDYRDADKPTSSERIEALMNMLEKL